MVEEGPVRVLEFRPLGGGCINQCAEVRTAVGRYFLKSNPGADHRFFAAEADGLAALAGSGGVRTPAVLARSGAERDDSPEAWLLLEWIDNQGGAMADWARLGRELAALHRSAVQTPAYGWHDDNLIGSLPQRNTWFADWPAFWARERIFPLAEQLREAGKLSGRHFGIIERAVHSLAGLLGPAAAADGRSLLHGDLWSGNVVFDSRGAPVLVDPAVYIGHREVDLAMTRLFGGFPRSFYRAYDDAWPPAPGRETRLAAYQLYPLLVHARLFGGGYVSSAVAAAESVLAAARSQSG